MKDRSWSWITSITRLLRTIGRNGIVRVFARGMLVAVAAGALALFLWKIPELQVQQFSNVKPEDRVLVNEYRKTLVQMIGGLLLLVGLYLTWRRIAATERNVQISQEGQITERFTRAIDQLGDTHDDDQRTPRIEVRLGGIYALERIARDSPTDHWAVMEVLTAYIRENAPWREAQSPPDGPPAKPRTDIQAVLTVLGRRKRRYEEEGQTLDLDKTNLQVANLVEAHLEKAHFREAHLEKANLGGAHLEEANLWETHLEKAFLWEAHLEKANLRGAHLENADLREAHLEKANRVIQNHGQVDELPAQP